MVKLDPEVSLLYRNIWALKPSCGQFGRGILLLDRLPSDAVELLAWAAAVGRGGLKGGNDVKEGCAAARSFGSFLIFVLTK